MRPAVDFLVAAIAEAADDIVLWFFDRDLRVICRHTGQPFEAESAAIRSRRLHNDGMVSPPTLELLAWISSRPRTYAEAIEAWRTNCPRHSVWEDALSDGLVQIARNEVSLTPLGRAALDRNAALTES